jgi:Ni/Fe-hydrogenase subunit HybB-like protein
VSITGVETASGVRYLPKWTELAVTGAIIAAGFAIFGLAAKYLPIFEEPHHKQAYVKDSAPILVRGAAVGHEGD